MGSNISDVSSITAWDVGAVFAYTDLVTANVPCVSIDSSTSQNNLLSVKQTSSVTFNCSIHCS